MAMEIISYVISFFDWRTVIILLFTFIISAFFMHRRYVLRTFERLGIPGPKPNFFTGNFYEIYRVEDPLSVWKSWAKKYGKLIGIYQGGYPVLIVLDVDIAKEILVKEFNKFSDRHAVFKASKPLGEDLTSTQGEKWRRIRSTLTPAFSASKLKQMSPIMNEATQILLEIIKEKAESEVEFDIYSMFQGLTMQVIGESVFALRVDSQRDPNDPFLVNSRKHFRSFSTWILDLYILFPPIRHIANFFSVVFGKNLFMKQLGLIVDNLSVVISERRSRPTAKTIDMLQLMLDAAEGTLDKGGDDAPDGGINQVGTVIHHKKGLTYDEVVSNSIIFLLAGFETTANALGFCAYNLAKHQDIQKKVQDEIDACITKEEKPSYEKVNSLTLLDQVINESLRLYPPISTFVSRLCIQDCKIGDILIQKGIKCEFPVLMIHHDPDNWPDPEKFDPSRFSPENKKNIKPMSFLPFGGGPRNCIGLRFALLEIKTALACLLRDFTIVPGNQYEDEIALNTPIALMNPKNGVWVKAIARV